MRLLFFNPLSCLQFSYVYEKEEKNSLSTSVALMIISSFGIFLDHKII